MRDPLLSLAPTELYTLAASIRNGRITPPFSALNLQRFIGSGDGNAISKKLGDLAFLGMSAEAMAACLELVADSLASRPPLENFVDLVTTGPEVGGVANRSTEVVVCDLFRNAQRSVLVAGYAVYQGQRVFHSLAELMVQNSSLQVRMFLDIPRTQGDTSSVSIQKAKFVHHFKDSQWPAGMPFPIVYCCAQLLEKAGSLHAKCIAIDDETVFVSSANFTEAGQQRNIEVGLLFQSRAINERLCRFFEALVDTRYFARAI